MGGSHGKMYESWAMGKLEVSQGRHVWYVLCSWVYLGTQHDRSDRNWAVICLGFGGVGHSPILWMTLVIIALVHWNHSLTKWGTHVFYFLPSPSLSWGLSSVGTDKVWKPAWQVSYDFFWGGLGTTAGYAQVLFLVLCPHPRQRLREIKEIGTRVGPRICGSTFLTVIYLSSPRCHFLLYYLSGPKLWYLFVEISHQTEDTY